MTPKKVVCITGGAGYVGEMLCDQLAKRDDIDQIIAIDKEPQSEFSKQIPKVIYIQSNLADAGWQEIVRQHTPSTIIHTAWQIRTMYGDPATQWRWNVEGSDAVFAFALQEASVKKLIYFSTASSYAAKVDNTLEHRFTESEGFRDDTYLYAQEKKVVEERLKKAFDTAGRSDVSVVVFRPAAITGPRGRYMRMRFGLQSALSGNLEGNFVYRIVTLLTSFVPATKGWVRQFVHEDDVNDAVVFFMDNNLSRSYEVFNLTPDSDPVLPADMAAAVGKKMVYVPPQLIRFVFFCFWHLTRGRVPTSPGSWRFYSYPIIMSGKKLAQLYQCAYASKDAFAYTDGRYEAHVPADVRRSKKTSTV
jgi:nucleoside-diphosphate-sugar epimerase